MRILDESIIEINKKLYHSEMILCLSKKNQIRSLNEMQAKKQSSENNQP